MPSAHFREAISKAYLADEDSCLEGLITQAKMTPAESAAVAALARDLVARVRENRASRTGVDAFTQEYALSSEEGVMLMCLAEALLRVPDADTADRLIRDKIAGRDWKKHVGQSESLFVNASTWALMLTGNVVECGNASRWDFEAIWCRLMSRLGEPVVRRAVAGAVRMLGRQFVLGRTIEEALEEAKPLAAKGYRFSFDMLGEAAVTRKDAARYLDHYRRAIHVLAGGELRRRGAAGERPGISVKLTALHPRLEYTRRRAVILELLRPLTALCIEARDAGLSVTIDAEEAERLDLTLDVFEALANEETIRDWHGLGIAVQAYQKRALSVIAWLAAFARERRRRIPLRLVKGAYWDTEIKRAQELGLPDYPVFTRKAGTDTSYLACARAMLADREAFFPQFATHNAHTIAAIEAFAGRNRDFEYQRLFGMGEALYELYPAALKPTRVGAATRIYAPVGSHEDLLSYLVRRLLENGANTSFVNRLANDRAAVEDIIADPVSRLAGLQPKRNPRIAKPEALFPGRRNSSGLILSDPAQSTPLLAAMRQAIAVPQMVHPIIGGREHVRPGKPVLSPSDRRLRVGDASEARDDDVETALKAASSYQRRWERIRGPARAEILERAADLFEKHRPLLMALLVREAGRTVGNALGEVREAVDLLRYYAVCTRTQFSTGRQQPGPVGEQNELRWHGRGVFACISPWNFPLSIFTGQVAAALAAGNAVLAKPAEQTPLIAAAAVRLMLEAGVPEEVLHLVPGDGARIGKILCADPRVSGIAFTGSTETAQIINRALAARDGPIPVLVAETGGLNAMVVDSTALPEQVARDVLVSAFDSAGQRCSSLRVLFLQDDVAGRMLDAILGAMDEFVIGDPFDLATDAGPIIDEEARKALEAHTERMTREAKFLKSLPLDPSLANGVFFPPYVFEIPSMDSLSREVFGPILHVVRFEGGRLDKVCDAVNASGYGLTMGVHSRISATADFIRRHARVGNIYVNRNQIGAVVEAQPFGGEGLSGTGPKAGGPHYLSRFGVERSFTVNSSAAGGNTALLTLEDD